jgi:hypothetical protein
MTANELADLLKTFETGWFDDLTIQQASEMLRKQAEEIQYWKDAFAKAMALNDHMKYLESQVYGGTTK